MKIKYLDIIVFVIIIGVFCWGISSCCNKINVLQKQIIKQTQEIEDYTKQLEERDKHIIELENLILEKDKTIEDNSAKIKKLETKIKKLQKTSYTTNSGGLTKAKGVVYFNGHKETYYSQKVLPGKGLRIPGRHVASDGTIRDENNYIAVASSDYPWGTIIETSLGTGRVYDSGCASGTVDIYTNW